METLPSTQHNPQGQERVTAVDLVERDTGVSTGGTESGAWSWDGSNLEANSPPQVPYL